MPFLTDFLQLFLHKYAVYIITCNDLFYGEDGFFFWGGAGFVTFSGNSHTLPKRWEFIGYGVPLNGHSTDTNEHLTLGGIGGVMSDLFIGLNII